MTALTIALVAAKPREKAGARTGARYAFQLHVSLAKVLELHEAGVDYRAVFDHFDDLAVLKGSADPHQVEFFQIKGKQQGGWTAANLCEAEGEAPSTTVGKMYHHTKIFGSAVDGSAFLTNASFKFTLADGTKTGPDHITIPYASIGSNDKARFAAALEPDFPSPRSPTEDSVLRFQRTDVPVNGYDVFLKGKLVDFVENKDGVAVGALYRTLIEDIATRANDSTECACLTDVFAHKSLSREDFEAAFAAAEARRGILDNWAIVDDELKVAGRASVARIRAQTATVEYLRDRSKRVHEAEVLAAEVRTAFERVKDNVQNCDSLLAAAEVVKVVLPVSALSIHGSAKVEAAILVELYEALNG
jgi:hypothetical protein